MVHRFIFGFLIFFALTSGDVRGQSDPCLAETTLLRTENLSVRLWPLGTFLTRFHVPPEPPNATSREIPPMAVGEGALWIGGRVSGEARAPYRFWPGPVGDDESQCDYNRVWTINRTDFDASPDSIAAAWPGHLGAPVEDGDGDPTNYDPGAGDRPRVRGDVMAWWMMNDVGPTPGSSPSRTPLGVDLRATMFAVERTGFKETLFFEVDIVNQSSDDTEDAYVGFFFDPLLGADPYFASDSTLGLGYAYGRDELDYESRVPAAVGATFLPPGSDTALDDYRASSFQVMYQWPDRDWETLNMLEGKRPDGLPITVGGNGWTGEGPATRFMFSGMPPGFWTMERSVARAEEGQPCVLLVSAPFDLPVGGRHRIRFAIDHVRGDSRIDSVRRLKRRSAFLHQGAHEFFGDDEDDRPIVRLAEGRDVLGFLQSYPNPMSTMGVVEYSIPKSMDVVLELFDVLGRRQAVLARGHQGAGVHRVEVDASGLPTGTYFCRFQANHLRFTHSVVVTR